MDPYSTENTRNFVLGKNQEDSTWSLRALRKSSKCQIRRTPILACQESEITSRLAKFLSTLKKDIPVLPDKLFNNEIIQKEAENIIREAMAAKLKPKRKAS